MLASIFALVILASNIQFFSAKNEVGTASDSITVDILGKLIFSCQSPILVPPEISKDGVELNPRLPTGNFKRVYEES